MNPHKIVNIPISVRYKLLNKSKLMQRPFQEVLRYYAIERFLYRLSISRHKNKFFLKGALMFKAWESIDHRPTMDIDLLGKTKNSVQNLKKIAHEICLKEVPAKDGLIFLENSVQANPIQEGSEYKGVRVEFKAKLDTAIIPMQIDIGFGDIIFPSPKSLSYPTILDFPAPKLYGYTMESVIAEKLEALIKRGITNSRMKDFFDIWTIIKQFSIDQIKLEQAIKTTFKQRETAINPFPECFENKFHQDSTKNAQWKAFLRKSQLNSVESLSEIVNHIREFISPILEKINDTETDCL